MISDTWHELDERRQALLVHQEWMQQPAMYNIPVVWRVEGNADPDAAVSALRAVIDQTDALRCRYRQQSGGFYQQIAPAPVGVIDYLDLRDGGHAAPDELVQERLGGFSIEPLDLEGGGPVRAQILRISDSVLLVHAVFHHICMDEESFEVLERRLLAGLTGTGTGTDTGADGTVTQPPGATGSSPAGGVETERSDAAYWATESVQLPPGPKFISRRAGRATAAGALCRRAIDGELLSEIRSAAAAAPVTLQAILFAAFALLVQRETRNDHFTLGIPVSARSHSEAGSFGYFVNTIPVACAVDGHATVDDILARLWEAQLDAVSHSSLPLERILRLQGADDGQSDIITVLFGFHQATPPARFQLPGISVTRSYVETATAKFEQTWSLFEHPRELELQIEYDTGVYAEADIELLFRHYEHALRLACGRRAEVIDELPPLSARELALVERYSAGEQTFTVDGGIHDLVESHARLRPGAPAVVCGGQSLTYAELDERASRVAAQLIRDGVGPENRVAVSMRRSADLVVALLAVLKAGGTYIALDPSYPAQRLEFMLQDSGTRVVLASESLADHVPGGDWDILSFERALEAGGPVPELPAQSPGTACYIIYTSGSTGTPKGVVVTHHNVLRLFAATDGYFQFTTSDSWSGFHSYAFDFSAWEIWGALTRGARLVLATDSQTRDFDEFYDLVVRERVTILSQTPTAFQRFESVDQASNSDTSLRAVVFGGEALDHPSVLRWAARHGWQRPALLNMYGITETTVHTTLRELTPADVAGSYSIVGRPLPDLSVHVADERDRPCALGVPGELLIGGAGVARGYYGNARLTAERFVPDGFSGTPGARLYRSGDRARLLADGRLQYLGRSDSMLKVRGFRIEPTEVEDALGRYPGVADCAVAAQADEVSGTVLVGYVVAAGDDVTASKLRRWLKSMVPDYMVPSVFVFLDELPQTPSGKLDRGSLPVAPAGRPFVDQAFEPPSGADEERLAALWSRALGISEIGRHDNYFDLGGDSIKSVKLLGSVRAAGHTLTMQEIFDNPTLAEQAAILGDATETVGAGRRSAEFALTTAEDRLRLPADVVDAYPPASLQLGMIYEMEREPNRLPYHNVGSVRVRGKFDAGVFADAVQRTVRRHPILRTSFSLTDYSEPLQLVHARADLPIRVFDIKDLDSPAQDREILEFIEVERTKPLDLSRAPLLRFAIHLLDDECFQWTITEHHAVFDGWSLHSTITEILGLLGGHDSGAARGAARGDAPPQSTYRDFIALEREARASQEHLEFWETFLSEAPEIRLTRWEDLPAETLPTATDDLEEWRYLGQSANHYGAMETLLPVDLCRGLSDLAHWCGVPLKTVLLAAHLRVLSYVCGSQDVVTGLTANGRIEEPDGEDARGLYLNTLPFRLRLPAGGWPDLIRAVFETERDVLPHRRVPFAAIRARCPQAAQLTEINFVYNHFHVLGQVLGADGVEIRDGKLGSFSQWRAEPTNFALGVGVIQGVVTDKLLLTMDYDTRRVSTRQALAIREYWLRTLEDMVRPRQRDYRDLPLMPPAETARVSELTSVRQETGAAARVHDLVAGWARREPGAVALVCAGQELTYAELDTAAERLADGLAAMGVRAGDRVALCMRRSPDLIAAMLAVLKAGAAYVPLDPEYPAERQAFMLRDSAAPFVVVDEASSTSLPEGAWTVLTTDGLRRLGATARIRPDLTAQAQAYVIYTSGSTGRPKGAVISHANVIHLLAACQEYFQFTQSDAWTGFHSYAFDFSVWEIWGCLCTGGRLVLADAGQVRDTEKFYDLIVREGVTVLSQTPTAFARLEAVDAVRDACPPLRFVVFGGEALEPTAVRSWAARHGWTSPRLVNMYGITETTVHVTLRELGADDVAGGASVIGRPLAHLSALVLDERGNQCPMAAPGELYIGGGGLAWGYLGNPRLTAERFVPDEFSGKPGRRLYRSGDRALLQPSGALRYLGRADDMLKVRGYRIEPAEVEQALLSCPGVAECAVNAQEDELSGMRLVAYVVASDPGLTLAEMRAWMRTKVPGHMVPSGFKLVAALPRTPSGKLDRSAITLPLERPTADQEFTPPEGATEESLALIWAQALGFSDIGRHDNYFDLGGDSIRSIRLVALARSKGLDLSIQDMFAAPTIAEQAAILPDAGAPRTRERAGAFSLITAADRSQLPDDVADAYPMAALQLGMVYEMERSSDLAPYHNVGTIRVGRRFDEAAFRAAVQRVVRRHPILRTSFAVAGYSEALQLVHRDAELPLTVADLRGQDEDSQLRAVRELTDRERSRLFTLSQAPLCRFTIHVLSDDAFQWTFAEHHAILDGWSWHSTISEILTEASRAPGAPVAAEPSSRYRDFIAAERAAESSAESASFWADALEEAPVTQLPGWAPDSHERHFHEDLELAEQFYPGSGPGDPYRAIGTLLPADLGRKLAELARACRVPLKTVLLAAHLRVLSYVCGSQDVVTGLTANGRIEEPDGDEARGLYLNTLPFRLRLPAGDWRDLIRAVYETERRALPHRRMPLAAILASAGQSVGLFDTDFVYNHFHVMTDAWGKGAVKDPVADFAGRTTLQRTHYGLVVACERGQQGDDLALELHYRLDRMSDEQARLFRGYLVRCLLSMTADPDREYRRQSLLSPAEAQAQRGWQDGPPLPGHPAVLDLVADWARRTPDAPALVSQGRRLSYRELDERAGELAAGLAARGVRAGDRVGLCLRRSADLITAMLAVLKAGAAYVPLDPGYPAERLEFMLRDSAVALVVTGEDAPDFLPRGPWPSVTPRALASGERGSLSRAASAAGQFCTVYTSGSTGRPKAVLATRPNVAALIASLGPLAIRSDDVTLQFADTSFDVATYEIWGTLCAGGTLVLAEPGAVGPAALAQILADNHVTVLHLTGSMLNVVAETSLDALGGLRLLVTGSEVVHTAPVNRITERWPDLRLHTAWGPTETTTFSVTDSIGGRHHDTEIPLGRPMAGMSVAIVDELGERVPTGTVGELVVAGAGLAWGYARRSAETAGRFRPGRGELTAPGGRIYHSGDMACWRPDGTIAFRGRRDSMVKVRGFRVELAEIERCAENLAGVSYAVAVAAAGQHLTDEICLFAVTDQSAGIGTDTLSAHLRQHLPHYMVPASIQFVDSLPVTRTGKVDKRRLAEAQVTRQASHGEAPGTVVGQMIAQIWCEMLDRPAATLEDQFLGLGGNSLIAIRIVHRIAHDLGVPITMGEFIAAADLGEIISAIERKIELAEA